MRTNTLLLILSLFLMCACFKAPEEKGTGYLTLNISQSTSVKVGIDFKDFTLRISDGKVEVLKERIGDLPDEIALPAGTYTIEAYSMEFDEPKFETPFYLGKTTVDIEAGETNEVSLVCSQGNAGIKLVWSADFSILFETYDAQIECNEGYLHYSSSEERSGYFLPGTVSVVIHADGQTINAGNIDLAARDMVTLYLKPKIEENPLGGLTIEINIDDEVNEREMELVVDPDSGNNQDSDNSETNPYNIAQSIERQGERGVWITGYIVGAKPSSGYNFANVIDTWPDTNIVLADDINEKNDRNVIFVQLTGSDYRSILNVRDNIDNLHKQIVIKGNLMSYLQRFGLQNISDCSFK